MNATTKIRFTRQTNIIGEREYHHETDTHRFVVRRGGRRDWVTEVWTLKAIGLTPPLTMIADELVKCIGALTLDEARVDIAEYIEQHGHKPVAPVEQTDTDAVEAPVRPVRVTEGHYPSDTHSTAVQDALGVLSGFPWARFVEGDSSLDSNAGGVRVESSWRDTVRVSWLERGMTMNPVTYAPFTEKLTEIVKTFRSAGWSARQEGPFHVYAWGTHTDD